MSHDTEEVGLSPEAHELNALEADTPAPDVLADRILDRYREIAAEAAQVERIADARIADIKDWRDGEVHRLQKRMDYLEERLRQLADLLIDPEKKKSMNLPSGRIGFRAGRDRLEVTDKPRFEAWAEKHGVGRSVWKVTKTDAMNALKNEGLAPEGAELVEGTDSFYVKVVIE